MTRKIDQQGNWINNSAPEPTAAFESAIVGGKLAAAAKRLASEWLKAAAVVPEVESERRAAVQAAEDAKADYQRAINDLVTGEDAVKLHQAAEVAIDLAESPAWESKLAGATNAAERARNAFIAYVQNNAVALYAESKQERQKAGAELQAFDERVSLERADLVGACAVYADSSQELAQVRNYDEREPPEVTETGAIPKWDERRETPKPEPTEPRSLSRDEFLQLSAEGRIAIPVG